MTDFIDELMRDFQRYTGDGLPGDPLGAPLPVGDPRSGVFTPSKEEIRQLLRAVVNNLGDGTGVNSDMLDGIHGVSFVRGDGYNNVSVILRVDNGDFILSDNTNTVMNWFWRSYIDKRLYIGSDDAVPTLRSDLDMGGKKITGSFVVSSNIEAYGSDIRVGLHALANTHIWFRDVETDVWRAFYYHNQRGCFYIQSREADGKIMHSGIPAGATGSMVFAELISGSTLDYGDNVAGSKIVPSNQSGVQSGAALSGTWKCMGYAPLGMSTLFLRIG